MDRELSPCLNSYTNILIFNEIRKFLSNKIKYNSLKISASCFPLRYKKVPPQKGGTDIKGSKDLNVPNEPHPAAAVLAAAVADVAIVEVHAPSVVGRVL